jgi:hypothetical protein
MTVSEKLYHIISEEAHREEYHDIADRLLSKSEPGSVGEISYELLETIIRTTFVQGCIAQYKQPFDIGQILQGLEVEEKFHGPEGDQEHLKSKEDESK